MDDNYFTTTEVSLNINQTIQFLENQSICINETNWTNISTLPQW
jgi:hypothetical protein